MNEQPETSYHASAFDIVDRKQEKEQSAIKQMEHFMLIALNGIMALLDA